MRDTLLIVNPASARGTTGKRWRRIESHLRELGLDFDAALTSEPAQAVHMARAAIQDGRPLVVACGGDGTVNEVANGFFDGEDPIRTVTRMGVLPLGTGGDFRRTFGIPLRLEPAAAVLRAGRSRRIDAGRVSYRSEDGVPGSCHFVNIADAGIGGEVVHRVNHGLKLLGGSVTFMLATVVSFARWRNKRMSVTVDGTTHEIVGQQVVVANCQYFGGGMRMAPEAQPDDGLFDVILVGDVGPIENLRGLSRIRSGTHLEAGNPKLTLARGKRVEVTSPERVRLDVDGEQPGLLPAVFEVVPGAIELVVP